MDPVNCRSIAGGARDIHWQLNAVAVRLSDFKLLLSLKQRRHWYGAWCWGSGQGYTSASGGASVRPQSTV